MKQRQNIGSKTNESMTTTVEEDSRQRRDSGSLPHKISDTEGFAAKEEDEKMEMDRLVHGQKSLTSQTQAKIFVYLTLAFCCVAASTLAYVAARNREENQLHDDYLGFVREIERITISGLRENMNVAESLSIEASSYAHDNNLSFPFITLPNFELRTRQARGMTHAELIVLIPLLDKNDTQQQAEWENFVEGNAAHWIEEGHGYQHDDHDDEHGEDHDDGTDAGPVPREIHDLLPELLLHGEEHGHDHDHRVLKENPNATDPDHHGDEDPDHHDEENPDHHHDDEDAHAVPAAVEHILAPLWQTGPAPLNASVINSDFLGFELFADQAAVVLEERKGSLSIIDETQLLHQMLVRHFPHDDAGSFDVLINHNDDHTAEQPYSIILDPVFGDPGHTEHSNIVAFHALVVQWDVYLQNILPDGVDGLEVVLSDSCGSVFTYVLNGRRGLLLGTGDLHDRDYEDLRGFKETVVIANVTTTLDFHEDEELHHEGEEEEKGTGHEHAEHQCQFVLDIYPSKEFEEQYMTQEPLISALLVAGFFVFASTVFLVYDVSVQSTQKKITKKANKSLALVSSLFPKEFRDRILQDAEEEVKRAELEASAMYPFNRARDQLHSFLSSRSSSASVSSSSSEDEDWDEMFEADEGEKKTKPIADLFPEATIVFADIVGFTAWSSTREPPQVFQLLEAIYHVFDQVASRRRVFKVETVGDCYVAVAGLPEPRKDHATTMVRFARDCLGQFNATVKALVVELGPDTEELQLRVGVHSGPVIAGVLRGERARFQLFGDTMNTTARLETTGQPSKIHVSQETADLLVAEGKGSWLSARPEKVEAKGKGQLQTYWLENTTAVPLSGSLAQEGDSTLESEAEINTDVPAPEPSHAKESTPQTPSFSEKYKRLVAWNFDILSKYLRKIMENRERRHIKPDSFSEIRNLELEYGSNRYILSEVQEIVRLPRYEMADQAMEAHNVWPSTKVLGQLQDYVQTLAAMYRENPFHNFEHASHVTMSVVKLLSRIVAPDMTTTRPDAHEALHDHTYGITSDPLTQFSLALSALIHDVDHSGVPNAQLILEKSALAAVYKNKSIAEQNSVDLAWDVLMDEEYNDLRRAIYTTKAEFLRFRQLVVNVVLATDIMDKDLGALRKQRWNKAFSVDSSRTLLSTEGVDDVVNRKATIVLEHLIQASDVSHTMQHWQIYRKWNQRFFCECYEAYLAGRADRDPSENWYEGEKGFFDFYIIPLARKLKDCGVFGVASDEYLQYAIQNRKEWERKGQELVAEMLEAYKRDHPEGPLPQRAVMHSFRETSNHQVSRKESEQMIMRMPTS